MQTLIRKTELRSQSNKLYATVCVHKCDDHFGPYDVTDRNAGLVDYYKVTRLSRTSDVLTVEKFRENRMIYGSYEWEIYYWSLIGEAVSNSGDKVKVIDV